jgi:hypothetical protein
VSLPPLTREVLGSAVAEEAAPEPWDAAVAVPPQLWADADRMLFRAERAAVYVEASGRVVLEAADEQARSDYDWLLYATAARALLTMRGRFNLHATLVVPPGGGAAVAVLGDSGAGKSTTTVALVRRGWRLACDDIVEVRHDTGGPVAHPVRRPLHLSDEAAVLLGLDAADGRPLPLRGKRAYAVPTALEPVPLGALVVLSPLAAREVAATRVDALAALPTVAASADRYGIATLPEHRAAFLSWSTALCAGAQVWDVRRPAGADTVEAVADAVAATVVRPA